MRRETKSLLPSLLPLLTAMTLMLANSLFDWISNEHFQKLESLVPYKILLTVCLLLLCILLSLVIFHLQRVRQLKQTPDSQFPSSTRTTSESELNAKHLRLLQNLSSGEKDLLRRYIEEDTKSIMLSVYDRVATGLGANGILFNPIDQATIHAQSLFNIQNWAWEMLKKNPKLLK